MSQQLIERLQTVQVSEPQEADGLQLFGLCWQTDGRLTYSTLDESLAAKTLEVTEVNDGGSVPELKVVNKSKEPVFLMSGEQLIGAKQNRVLNTSIMLPGESDLAIPVSCVEAGRWHYRSPKFASAGTMSHSFLRKMMSQQVKRGYSRKGGPASDQGEVWKEVARKLTKMGTASPSYELQEAYADYEYSLGDTLGRLKVPQDCCGAAFAFAGQIAGMDLFDKPTTLVKLWPKLVRAYALDAWEGIKPQATPATAYGLETGPSAAVRRWLQMATQAKVEAFKSPGLGQDVRLEGPGLVGASLLVNDQPVHVEIFALK